MRNDRTLSTVLVMAGGVVAVSALAASWWGVRVMGGVLAGGAWNLASLWCLAHLLSAWLGSRPSTRRAIAWLVLKFPFLYLLAFGILRSPSVSLIGFSIGFTVVLIVVVAWLAARASQLAGFSSCNNTLTGS